MHLQQQQLPSRWADRLKGISIEAMPVQLHAMSLHSLVTGDICWRPSLHPLVSGDICLQQSLHPLVSGDIYWRQLLRPWVSRDKLFVSVIAPFGEGCHLSA
eukprot:1149430-Pelagomonas_calceolata.AAC.6